MLCCEDTNKQAKKPKKLGNTLKKLLLCQVYWLRALILIVYAT